MPDIVYRSKNKSGVIAFKAAKSITRPANTTTYAVGDLINANAATGLIEFDFGSENANAIIELNSLSIISSNGAATLKLSAGVYLFNNVTVKGAGDATQKDDNAAFIVTNAETVAKGEAMFEDVSSICNIGTATYAVTTTERAIVAKLDSNGKIFAAAVANNAYVPASEEVLTLVLKGYIHG